MKNIQIQIECNNVKSVFNTALFSMAFDFIAYTPGDKITLEVDIFHIGVHFREVFSDKFRALEFIRSLMA